MTYDSSRRSVESTRAVGGAAAAMWPGKRALVERVAPVEASATEERSAPVQLAAAPSAPPGEPGEVVAGGLADAFLSSSPDPHAIAARGTAGGGEPLPHLEAIQASFGHHDVSDVRAHVGGAAAEASGALGARGFATGRDVGFAREPDLHLAAHEAAHVVQQGGGVHLDDGLGRPGDAYERHADAVADCVVRGESAEALLDGHAGGGAGLQLDLGDDAVSLLRGAVARGQQAIDDVIRSIPVPDLGPALRLVPAAARELLRRYWPDHTGWMAHVQGEGTLFLEATDLGFPAKLELGGEVACDVSVRREAHTVTLGFAPSVTGTAQLEPSIKVLELGVGTKVKNALGVTVTINLDEISWPTGALDALFAGDMRGALRHVVASAISVGRNTQIEAELSHEARDFAVLEGGLNTLLEATVQAGNRIGAQITVANPTESRDGKVELRGEAGVFGRLTLDAAGGDGGDPTGGIRAVATALLGPNAGSALTAEGSADARFGMRVTRTIPRLSTPDAPGTWQIGVFGAGQGTARLLGQEGQLGARGEVVLALPDVPGFVAAVQDGRLTDVGDLALLAPFSEINGSLSAQVLLRDYLHVFPMLSEIVPLLGMVAPNRIQLSVQASFRATREQIQAYVNRSVGGAVDVIRQLASGQIRQAVRTHADTVTENLADLVGFLDKITFDAQVGYEGEIPLGTPGAGDVTGATARGSGHVSATYHRDWTGEQLGLPSVQRWLRELIAGDAVPDDRAREPWERAARQERALEHLTDGQLQPGEGELLAQGIESQVPDLAYMREVRGGARSIATLLMPGVGRLSTKHMNDHLIGYELNNTRVVPGLQRAIATTFADAGGYASVGQTYKSSSFTSQRASSEIVAQVPQLLPQIDQRARPVLVDAFNAGEDLWRDDPERVRAIRQIKGIVDRDAFQYPLTYGAAAIDGDGSATYAEALADRMHATEAALISRTVDEPPMEAAPGASRGQGYDPAVFQRFCQEAEALRDQIRASGNRLTYGGASHLVFVTPPGQEEQPSAEVIADYRRERIHQPRETQTYALFRQYMHHINAFDYLKDFTGREAGAIDQRIAEALPVLERLRSGAPVDAAAVESLLHEHPATGEDDPQSDTASAAQFYETARRRTDRIVVRADIRGLGVTLAQDYAATMRRAAQPGADLDRLALGANDGVVEFRRRAVAQMRAAYQRLQPQVVAEARAHGDEQTAHDVELELDPLFLLGGDEITLSLHAAFEPVVPQFVAVLQDDSGARARVGISRTDDAMLASDSRDAHIVAFGHADASQSRVKHYEDRQLVLVHLVAAIQDPDRRARGQRLVDELSLDDLFGEYDGGVSLRHSRTGDREDDAELERRVDAVEAELRRLGS